MLVAMSAILLAGVAACSSSDATLEDVAANDSSVVAEAPSQDVEMIKGEY